MEMTMLDNFEKKALETVPFDRVEKMDALNSKFASSIKPEKGVYGITEIIKENGIVERLSRNELGNIRKEYFQDGKLTHVREKIADKSWKVTRYDDAGNPYLSETSVRGDQTIISHTIELAKNAEIHKGNFTSITDDLGRPILNKITDVQISKGRENLSSALRDHAYREGDQRGHIIADILGGPPTKENIVAQMGEVNQSQMIKIENEVRRLKELGHKVDYEVKVNYTGKDLRPSSFEPRITVDGKPYELTGELAEYKKIYNDVLGEKAKVLTAAKEGLTSAKYKALSANYEGVKQGAAAATMVAAISTVDNVSAYTKGEISAEEMVMNIAQDTGKAGLVGYGAGFVTEGIAIGMESSSKQLIRSLAGANVPAGMVAFGIETYDSISDYAQGKIDTSELVYDLGDGAVSVAGSMAGAQYGAAAGTLIMPGAGTFAGGLVGGMVGYAVTSEAYKTAVAYGSEEAAVLGEKAQQMAGDTIELAKAYVPEKADVITASINEFAAENGLPFQF